MGETELIYQSDMEALEFKAKVVSVEGNKIELDRTAFYPASGGIATDTGELSFGSGLATKVMGAKKDGLRVLHEVESMESLLPGTEVVGRIDSERRKILSRYHTAAHLITGVLTTKHGILVTGNQMEVTGGRIDVDWEEFSKENIQKAFDEANELIKKNLPVKIYWLSKEDVEKRPELVKLAKGLLNLPKYRIVEIVGLDAQPDGGCHVTSLGRIGSSLEFTGYESKGKRNKRFKFVIRD